MSNHRQIVGPHPAGLQNFRLNSITTRAHIISPSSVRASSIFKHFLSRVKWLCPMDSHSIMEYYLDENLWTKLSSLEENLRKYEELVWKMCHSGRRIPLDRTMPRFEQNWINFHKFGQCFTFCDNWKWKYKKLKRKWGRIPRMATCRFSTKLNKFSQMWKLLGKGEISPQWKFFPKIFTNSGTEVEEEA